MALRRTALAIALIAGALLSGRAASAQGDDLATGRKLFAEALADEDNRNFEAALEKYKRVQSIRDTVAVRYRIGAAYEGLGKFVSAVDAYARAAELGIANNTDPEIVKAAQEKVAALEPKTAHLSLRVPETAPADAEVRVDDATIPAEKLSDVRLDPGTHVVTATATGARSFRAEVTLSEGGRAELPIVLEPVPPPPEPAPPESSPLQTVGIVTGIVGGVLVVGGAVMFLVRANAISELNESCPGGACPLSRQDELTSTHDRATTAGPVGGVLLGVGGAAIATGIVLYVVARPAKASVGISPTRSGGVLHFGGTF